MSERVVELVTTKETYDQVLDYFEQRGWSIGGMKMRGPYLFMALYPKTKYVAGNYRHVHTPSYTYSPTEGFPMEFLEALNGS